MIDFLFVSNGYGEDAIGANIAEIISAKYQVAAFPLVGHGKPYQLRGISVVKSFPALPGEGVSLRKDIQGGLLSLLRLEWKALSQLHDQVEEAVSIGDIFPTLLSCWALKRKFSFVGTAKSVDVQPYNVFERFVLRKASRIYVRDERTATSLVGKGVKAEWAGNPMMDEVAVSKVHFPAFTGRTIAILPGSREDAPQNLSIQAEALNALSRNLSTPIRGLVAIPPTLTLQALLSKFNGWDGMLVANSEPGILGQIVHGNVLLLLVSGCLGDVLRASSLVFGQAGTANEQAAGLGKPVIAFDFSLYRNGTLSWYRWRQKKLLGESLVVVYPNAELLAAKAANVFQDRTLYLQMAEEGKARLGASGASPKIAEALMRGIGGTSVPAIT